MFDASYLVRYISRFTEESFCALIAVIFAYKALVRIFAISSSHPPTTPPVWYNTSYPSEVCYCNKSNGMYTSHELHYPATWGEVVDGGSCSNNMNNTLVGTGCADNVPVPDVFYFSLLLFLGTFLIDFSISAFKETDFLPAKARQILSYFSVTIAVVLMCLVDYLLGYPTPKLHVPHTFRPTWEGRGWFIPFLGTNEAWIIAAAVLPAIFCVILIFMDQQITAVIINRKENKLKKGCGYHLDLLVCGVGILICSLLGIPWCVASTVSSVTHLKSLTVESETAVPGESHRLIGARENRVTNFICSLLIGLSILMRDVLQIIPLATLYGVLLIMGIKSLKGMQFIDRILVVFMPNKYQPDYVYLQRVQIKRVHLFTFIQCCCFAIMWIFEAIEVMSSVFPLTILMQVAVRKLIVSRLFSQEELDYLDDLEPDHIKKKKHKLEEMMRKGVLGGVLTMMKSASSFDSKRYTDTSLNGSVVVGNAEQPDFKYNTRGSESAITLDKADVGIEMNDVEHDLTHKSEV